MRTFTPSEIATILEEARRVGPIVTLCRGWDGKMYVLGYWGEWEELFANRTADEGAALATPPKDLA